MLLEAAIKKRKDYDQSFRADRDYKLAYTDVHGDTDGALLDPFSAMHESADGLFTIIPQLGQ